MRRLLPFLFALTTILHVLPARADDDDDDEEPIIIRKPPPGSAKPAGGDKPSGGDKPALPVAADKGRISGIVVDAKTGEPVIEAQVTVVGSTLKTLSDVEGRYTLTLAPGTYTLRVWYELYQARRITQIEVAAGQTVTIDVQLGSDQSAVQEVVVVAQPDTATAAVQLVRRKKAATVSDAVSAEQIARSPDSNASDAVKRVVAATVTEGKYVTIRGLGGRYSTTLLNGVQMPSVDPDQPSVPLDLFPAALLANLTVVKTFSPDIPGNFAGGSLNIETRDFPTKFGLKVKLGISGNTETTFRKTRTYDGGGLDLLGFDDGTRKLPSRIPIKAPLLDASFTPEQIESAGEAFKNVWTSRLHTALPNGSLGVTVGDTVRLGRRKLGYLATASYNHKYERRLPTIRRLGAAGPLEEFSSEVGLESTNIGALGSLGLELDSRNRLGMIWLYSHSHDDRAQYVAGFSNDDNKNIEGTRLQWVERQLLFGQLTGEHALMKNRLNLAWQGDLSVGSRGEPDTRDTTYNQENTTFQFENGPGSGERFFSDLSDLNGGGGLHVTVPFKPLRVKLGGAVQASSRSFDARRFRFRVFDDTLQALRPAEQLFTAANIAPSRVEVSEVTLAADTYDASLAVYAGYAMLDVTALEPFRLIGGVRYEHSRQTLQDGSKFAVDQTRDDIERKYDDVLPAVNAVYSLSDSINLRGAYSTTVARPQFREMAPFSFFDYTKRRSISGNTELVETRIHNADLRFEKYLAATELLAGSLFYKRFQNPIESVITSATGDIQFKNAEGADTYGLELEGRVNLRHLHKQLREVDVGANLSLIRSRVDLSAEQAAQSTNLERPLQGQSPYVVNVELNWSHVCTGSQLGILYNVFGPRITDVGAAPLDDAKEQPFHRIDVAYNQKLPHRLGLKLAATNVLGQDVVRRQGAFEIERYASGIGFSASLEWSPY